MPLTMLSSHFNTPTVLGAKNSFKPAYLTVYKGKNSSPLTSSAVGVGGIVAGCDCLLKWQVVAGLCDVSITQFMYTDSL